MSSTENILKLSQNISDFNANVCVKKAIKDGVSRRRTHCHQMTDRENQIQSLCRQINVWHEIDQNIECIPWKP